MNTKNLKANQMSTAETLISCLTKSKKEIALDYINEINVYKHFSVKGDFVYFEPNSSIYLKFESDGFNVNIERQMRSFEYIDLEITAPLFFNQYFDDLFSKIKPTN
jgi:hypothetical protein